MTHLSEIEAILDSEEGAGDARALVFEYLANQADRGASAALECLLTVNDDLVAEYLAQYLALIPGRGHEKTLAAERLRQTRDLAPAASRLVPWLSPELVDAFVADFLAAEDPDSALADVLYEVGVYFPDRLRPFGRRIDDKYVQRALLSGGDDSVADSFLEIWKASKSRELKPLVAMALMRTERAVDNVLSLEGDFNESAQWETILELAGRLPGAGRASGYFPAYMGFVTDSGGSGHVVGGRSRWEVPLCLVCEAPAAPLLRIDSGRLPYDLSSDPEFYWYSCDCEALDSVTVQVGSKGLRTYYGPQGRTDPGVSITPGERSLVLEKHPNQVGVSLQALPGGSAHQVGGLPQWREPDIHPRCPECSTAMPYLATMDSGHTPFGEMGFDGILYCFWCDGCRVSSTQIQH